MQKAAKTAIYKVIHSSIQFQSKILKFYTGIYAKTSKTKTPETNCMVLSNLNITIELIKFKLLFYNKVTPNLSLQSCPLSAANTILGICYTCEELCCSAHGCCAVECGIACCAAQRTAIATFTIFSPLCLVYASIHSWIKLKHANGSLFLSQYITINIPMYPIKVSPDLATRTRAICSV